MGFDVYGVAPADDRGGYFRNNIWWWRPLWSYVGDRCADILTEKEIAAGSFNDGHRYSAKKAVAIADRLDALLASGAVAKDAKQYEADLAALPDETCEFCDGTRKRDDKFVRGTCNACDGKGKVRPFETHYPFAEENVHEFAAFVRASGGFEVY